MKPSNLLVRLPLLLLGWIVVLLSLKALREPDLWWMFRTGEWMLENGGVTYTDPFSYTMPGVDWFNVKWLYELLLVLFVKIGGPEFVFVLQAFVSVGLLMLLTRTAAAYRQPVLGQASDRPTEAWIWLALLAFLVMDFRMIGRPETMSHLMTAAYLLLLWRERTQPSPRRLYILVALQALWANLHEAYGTGMVLLVGYLVAVWSEYFLNSRWLKRPQTHSPLRLSALVGIALLAVALHPRGYGMWLHPFNIFGQLQDNKFTTELVSIFDVNYWYWEAYANLAFIGSAAFFFAVLPWSIARPQGTGRFRHAAQVLLERVGLGQLALWAMLSVLSLTAYRNIPFAVIASAPWAALLWEQAVGKLRQRAQILQKLQLPLLFAALIGAYSCIATEYFYRSKDSHDHYGMQVLSGHNPVGAARFVQANGLAGKRCFSDYLTSSYLLWKLQPEFKTYIDLRDLDIFPQEFFYDFAAMVQIPPVFQQKDSLYNFDYVVLFRPQFAALHSYLISSNDYELVFLDPVAAVYVKNKPEHQALIEQYGYERRGYADILQPLPVEPASGLPYAISKIINPLYTPQDYTDINYDLIRASFYQSVGRLEDALKFAELSLKTGKEPWQSRVLMGNVYNTWAFQEGVPDSLRREYINRAFSAFDAALAARSNYTPALTGKAILWMQQGDFVKPITFLKKALETEPYAFDANQYMAMCYKMQIQGGQGSKFNMDQWLHYTRKLDRINPDNPNILLELGIIYCRKNDCSNATRYFDRVESVPGLPEADLKAMEQCKTKCK